MHMHSGIEQLRPRSRRPDESPLLSLRGTSKTYETVAGSFPALNGIDLDIFPGDFLAVVGILTQLRLVSIPASLPYLFAATRLAVPRALLGVMIAEWLATGTGLGNLLNQSRGYLDYGMIWTVAVVSVMLSVAFYQIVVFVERQVLARRGMRAAE